MGPDSHVLTFPVNHGETLNIVAFHTNSDPWPDFARLTRPAKREDAIRDYEGFGPNVQALLRLTKPDLDCVGFQWCCKSNLWLIFLQWAIFDLGDHPVPTFYKGRICISGDAAHATSPHHGAGAGFVIEDSAILAALLEDPRVKTPKDLEAVFAAFDANRRERTQGLVQSSRHMGNLYEWRVEGVGDDLKKIEKEINERNAVIWNVDVKEFVEDAKKELGKRLKSSSML